jgi:hypothetical protein
MNGEVAGPLARRGIGIEVEGMGVEQGCGTREIKLGRHHKHNQVANFIGSRC